jgi:hypothetical protein
MVLENGRSVELQVNGWISVALLIVGAVRQIVGGRTDWMLWLE